MNLPFKRNLEIYILNSATNLLRAKRADVLCFVLLPGFLLTESANRIIIQLFADSNKKE